MNRSQRQKLFLLIVVLAVLGALLARRFRQVSKPWGGGPACGETCGVVRWAVKTLSDSGASAIDFHPRAVTVRWLTQQAAPVELREEARSSPIEEQVFVVRARLVGIKEEQDRDVHIVIADLDDDSATMIVEIPSPMCAGACASGHASEFEAARDAVETRCGPPRERFETVAGEQIVTVTGIGFFDFLHRQRGVAPNGIELHPVLSVQFE